MSEFCDESEGSAESPPRSRSCSVNKGDSADTGGSMTGDGDWFPKSDLSKKTTNTEDLKNIFLKLGNEMAI